MKNRTLLLPAAYLSIVIAVACTSGNGLPGKQAMGSYRFTAEAIFIDGGGVLDCALTEFTSLVAYDAGDPDAGVPESWQYAFDFDAVFSSNPDNDEAWVALGDPAREQAAEGPFGLYRLLGLDTQQNSPRPGAWDGQRFHSTDEVERVFPSRCGGCGTRLEESLDVFLLSQSQSAALGNQCPASIRDTGVPGDGGVTPPAQTPYGFDAVRGCGDLRTQVFATDGGSCDPACSSCRVHFRVTGERR